MTPKYRADIDGLRAIAVLSVLLFHVGLPQFSGGYVGVDIFFVISGYLITTIIVREIAEDNFSIRTFYERRFRRILPALVVVMLFTLGTGALLLDPANFADLGKSSIATALFSSNILFFFQSGYFDGPAEMKPLLHTWSLAVEEQYYIFFPLLLIFIAKLEHKHYRRSLVAITLLSFIASVVVTEAKPDAAFYLIPTRAWELFVGSLLAIHLIPPWRTQGLRELGGLAGLALLLVAIFLYTPKTPFPGYTALLPVLGSALIIHAGVGGVGMVGRLLSLSPVVFIGLISYSLYLWHWPLIVYTKYYSIHPLSGGQMAAIIAAALLLATLSWRFVERPFRRRQLLATRAQVLNASGVVILVMCGVGLTLVVEQGFTQRYADKVGDNYSGIDPEWEQWGKCERRIYLMSQGVDLCTMGVQGVSDSFFYWGDSHARALASAVDLGAKEAGVRGRVATHNACPPLLGIERPKQMFCERFNQRVITYLTAHPELKTIVFGVRWSLSATGERYKYESGRGVELMDLEHPEQGVQPNIEMVELGFKRTLALLHSLGRQVVVVAPLPEVGYEVPAVYYSAQLSGRDADALIAPTRAEYAARAGGVRALLERLAESEGFRLIDPIPYLCDAERCPVSHAGHLLYRDDDHLSTYGARRVAPLFRELFEGL